MLNDILSGKKIILGVTGCIAAYKACYLTRELRERGAEVRVVMTPSALQFIAPLTFSSLSGNEVIVNVFPESQQDGTGLKTWHIDYALWADLMIIAPATVNTAAKIAHGFADNALTILALALRCPLIIAPAADTDMYEKPITRQNLNKLSELGHYVIEAEVGSLASGLSGIGRFPEPEKIIDAVELILSGYTKDLSGKKILITAGPTFEDIDPVRFIGNRSSGKMGFNLVKAAYLRGAEVTLISGPVYEKIYPEINTVKVRSTFEMKEAVEKYLKDNQILIMSAAVADYQPESAAIKKIKKEEHLKNLKLKQTVDILASINKRGKKIIGFALETDEEKANALKKLKDKNLDMIVLNSLSDERSGFEYDTNKITIFHRSGKEVDYPLQSKFQAANKILSEILKLK
jgi:phosphopantothenoylcysteine decarboxylase/phosphopantothenate--cysteine ligase